MAQENTSPVELLEVIKEEHGVARQEFDVFASPVGVSPPAMRSNSLF